MNILDNELVRKYFGCIENDWCGTGPYHSHSMYTSERLLQAMQEPLKKTDRYLYINGAGNILDLIGSEFGSAVDGFHPSLLRLPDRFQKPPTLEEVKRDYHVCDCEFCGHPDTIHVPAKPTPSPEKCYCDRVSDGMICPPCADSEDKAVEALRKPKDEVEEKIKSLIFGCYENEEIRHMSNDLEKQLRELIELARKK